MDVIGALKAATKQFPAAKIVWISVAVAAAAAFVSSLQLGLATLGSGTAFVLIVTVLFGFTLLLYNACRESANLIGARWLVSGVAWVISISIVVVIGAFLTAFITGKPRHLAVMIGLPDVVESSSELTVADEETGTPPPNSDLRTFDESSTSISELGSLDVCLESVSLELNLEEFERKVRKCEDS